MATIQKELRSLKPEVQKNAIKRVVAGMTIGTDMSILFADVVNLMQSNDLELKKMVYLYTMKYAKANPDLAILAINTFKKDTRDPNLLIQKCARRENDGMSSLGEDRWSIFVIHFSGVSKMRIRM